MRAQPTVAAPRADWMLLRMHFLRVFAPLAIVCFGCILVFLPISMLVSRAGPVRENPGYGLNIVTLVLALVLALPVGAAVFSRPFKEQHILLFQSLPVSRLRQWVLFASSSALSLLGVYAGLALLRPGAAALASEGGGLPIFAMIVAILFSAGLCFSLVAVRIVSVYMSGFVAALVTPALVGLAIVAPYLVYYAARLSANDLATVVTEEVVLPRTALWIAGATIVLMFLAASAFFYVRGEITLTRVQMRNAAIVVGAIALLALLATPLVYAFAGGRPRTEHWAFSDDARWVAVAHTRREAPWKNEVRVYDLTAGTSRSWKISGLRHFEWTAKNELLAYVRDISWWRRLWYLRAGRDFVQRWSPGGEKLGELRVDGAIRYPRQLDAAHQVMVLDAGDVTRVIALEHGDRPRTLLEVPAPSDTSFGNAGIVSFRFAQGESRAWRLRLDGAQELPRAPIASTSTHAWVVDDVFYPGHDALVRKIEATWPVPRDSGERVAYAFHQDARWVYALVCRPGTPAKLSALDTATKQWKRISDAVPIGEIETPRADVGYYDATTASSTFFGQNIALFTERKGDRIAHRLYDSAAGTTTTFFERAAKDARVVNMHAERDRVNVSADQTTIFEAEMRNGRLTQLPQRPGGYLIGVWPDGTQVRMSMRVVTVVNEHGVVRKIDLNPHE